jgi:hypothetical protein
MLGSAASLAPEALKDGSEQPGRAELGASPLRAQRALRTAPVMLVRGTFVTAATHRGPSEASASQIQDHSLTP